MVPVCSDLTITSHTDDEFAQPPSEVIIKNLKQRMEQITHKFQIKIGGKEKEALLQTKAEEINTSIHNILDFLEHSPLQALKAKDLAFLKENLEKINLEQKKFLLIF